MQPFTLGELLFWVDGTEENRTWHPAIVTRANGFEADATVFRSGEETYVTSSMSGSGMPGFLTRTPPPA